MTIMMVWQRRENGTKKTGMVLEKSLKAYILKHNSLSRKRGSWDCVSLDSVILHQPREQVRLQVWVSTPRGSSNS